MKWKCEICNEDLELSEFLPCNLPSSPLRHLHTCKKCASTLVEGAGTDFSVVCGFLQQMNIGFNVDDWIKLQRLDPHHALEMYLQRFGAQSENYADWSTAAKQYKELLARNELLEHFPEYEEVKMKELALKWGEECLPEEYYALEELYHGILETYGINGKLQVDQAKKVCKISLIVDKNIRSGENPKEWINAYSKIIGDANFTPKNVKDGNDFESVGELYAFLEKSNWLANYYQDNPKDNVDMVMKNIQDTNRELYINEPGIADDIERRIAALKSAEEIEARLNRQQVEVLETTNDIIEEDDDEEEFSIDL